MTTTAKMAVSMDTLNIWRKEETRKTIRVSNETDYNFLMRHLERVGYRWFGGQLPTEYNAWTGEGSVIRIIISKDRQRAGGYSILMDVESHLHDEPGSVLESLQLYNCVPLGVPIPAEQEDSDYPFEDTGLIKTVTVKKINEDVLKIGSVLGIRAEGRVYNHIVTEIREDEIVAFNGVFHRRIPMSTLESSEHIAEHIPEGAVDLVM